jgi:hypothetical protein
MPRRGQGSASTLSCRPGWVTFSAAPTRRRIAVLISRRSSFASSSRSLVAPTERAAELVDADRGVAPALGRNLQRRRRLRRIFGGHRAGARHRIGERFGERAVRIGRDHAHRAQFRRERERVAQVEAAGAGRRDEREQAGQSEGLRDRSHARQSGRGGGGRQGRGEAISLPRRC